MIGLDGPCNWPAMGCPSCDGVDCLTASQRTELEAMAQYQLWAATGRVYGTCEVTVYPCNDYSTICGTCNSAFRQCGCSWVDEIKLAGPVASITSVVVDGVTLSDTAYRVDDWQWLVRLDGGTWPANADPTTDDFLVTYELGEAPPAGAGINVGRLVCSWSSCSNSGCRIPKNTQQLTRQGVTMLFNQTGFGVLEVDQWVASVNMPTRAGAVHSPDLPHVRQTTWAAPSSP